MSSISSAPSAMQLLHQATGSDASAGATTVDSFQLPADWSAKDELVIEVQVESITQATAGVQLYDVTDGTNLLSFSGGLAIGETQKLTLKAQQSRLSATTIVSRSEGRGTTVGAMGTILAQAVATAMASLAIGIRHTGVTAGGTFGYVVAYYRLRGA